ncbi:hypothetical protein CR513_20178, partial [Mucuna pruriens]
MKLDEGGLPCVYILLMRSPIVDNMANNNKTLNELAPNDIKEQAHTKYMAGLRLGLELESSKLFHGLVGEDPHKHVKEFHVMYSTMRPHGILEDYIKMKAFPFSMDGLAKN